MLDRIAKEKLNVILIVDSSKSMGGRRIAEVEGAINEIKDYLIDLQDENSNVDFYITLVTFGTEAKFYNDEKELNVNDFDFNGIKTGGLSNLHLAYQKLEDVLKKVSKGGIMADYGGVAPIIILLTDGHPTKNLYKEELKKLEELPWYRVALKYGIAIELNDSRTLNVLKDFVKNNGDVIECYDSNLLKRIIKIIVLTASQVKSKSTNLDYEQNRNDEIKQLIAEKILDVDGWEW